MDWPVDGHQIRCRVISVSVGFRTEGFYQFDLDSREKSVSQGEILTVSSVGVDLLKNALITFSWQLKEMKNLLYYLQDAIKRSISFHW